MLIAFAIFYPRFFTYMKNIFEPTWFVYVGLLFAEVILVEVYFLTWDKMAKRKGAHILIGSSRIQPRPARRGPRGPA